MILLTVRALGLNMAMLNVVMRSCLEQVYYTGTPVKRDDYVCGPKN